MHILHGDYDNIKIDENLTTGIITPDREIVENSKLLEPAYLTFENYDLQILKIDSELKIFDFQISEILIFGIHKPCLPPSKRPCPCRPSSGTGPSRPRRARPTVGRRGGRWRRHRSTPAGS